jgi:hypothetical protein
MMDRTSKTSPFAAGGCTVPEFGGIVMYLIHEPRSFLGKINEVVNKGKHVVLPYQEVG